jgi:hypothetical protein
MSHALFTGKSAAADAKSATGPASNGLRFGIEQEAVHVSDHVDAVGSLGNHNWSLSNMSIGGPLQRECERIGGGKCEESRNKSVDLTRERGFEKPNDSTVPPIVPEVLRSPGQLLDASTRAFMEPRFGHDFSQVRVHTDSNAVASARAVNALAYTVGRDVVFGAEQLSSTTSSGRQVLAHELAHVVQQARGETEFPSSSEASLERDAESAARTAVFGNGAVVVGEASPTRLARTPQGGSRSGAVQSSPALYQVSETALPGGKVQIRVWGRGGDPIARPGLEKKYPLPKDVGLPGMDRWHLAGPDAIGAEAGIAYAPKNFNVGKTAQIENLVRKARTATREQGGEVDFDFTATCRVVGDHEGVQIRVLEEVTWKVGVRAAGSDNVVPLINETAAPAAQLPATPPASVAQPGSSAASTAGQAPEAMPPTPRATDQTPGTLPPTPGSAPSAASGVPSATQPSSEAAPRPAVPADESAAAQSLGAGPRAPGNVAPGGASPQGEPVPEAPSVPGPAASRGASIKGMAATIGMQVGVSLLLGWLRSVLLKKLTEGLEAKIVEDINNEFTARKTEIAELQFKNPKAKVYARVTFTVSSSVIHPDPEDRMLAGVPPQQTPPIVTDFSVNFSTAYQSETHTPSQVGPTLMSQDVTTSETVSRSVEAPVDHDELERLKAGQRIQQNAERLKKLREQAKKLGITEPQTARADSGPPPLGPEPQQVNPNAPTQEQDANLLPGAPGEDGNRQAAHVVELLTQQAQEIESKLNEFKNTGASDAEAQKRLDVWVNKAATWRTQVEIIRDALAKDDRATAAKMFSDLLATNGKRIAEIRQALER